MSTGPAPVSTALPSVAVQARASEWAHYAWQPNHPVCYLTTGTLKMDGKLMRVRSTGTANIATSLSSPNGMSYVVARDERITVALPGKQPRTKASTDRMFYTITSDGQLNIDPQSTNDSTVDVRYLKDGYYPVLTPQNYGRTLVETVKGRATTADVTGQDAIAYVTTDGSPDIAFDATFKIRVVRAEHPVATPAGTFHDAVAVQQTLVSMHVTNITDKAVVRAFETGFRDTTQSDTTWWARGVGLVMESGGGLVEKLVRCPLEVS